MKMYFYYGAMGSSKTANALMTRFSWEDKGKKVALLKPSIDNRDGVDIVKSRAGLMAKAILIYPDSNIRDVLPNPVEEYDNLIVDEAQFLTKEQVDELRDIADNGTFVMCYGLKADFMGNLFEGSKRILEMADSLREIVTMCPCGKKAIMNARYSGNRILYEGEQVVVGGNESYMALCHRCYKKGVIPSEALEDFTVEKD
ncbi:MAG: thymidine kinase [Lachnospiraceae bacterium]|nr:thymidine kinase [Lachnospiraceae bacterium]MBQ8632823.1 thymidine kinase [Lachnospiraceae bacterium]